VELDFPKCIAPYGTEHVLIAFPLAFLFAGQSIESSDLVIVGLLVVLEGLLSIDNALVLGMLAKRLPKHMRARALSYGLIGAFVFRFLAILLSAYLLQWTFVKFIGGAYLVYISVKHLFFEQYEGHDEKVVLDDEGQPALVDAETGLKLDVDRENIEIEQRVPIAASLVTEEQEENISPVQGRTSEAEVCDVSAKHRSLFWRTVLVIELTDIAFAVDSILAAMALAGSRHEKLWVVITGGILGVVLMRFAAAVFVRLLEKYPRFETSAYLLVVVIGLKLLADWAFNSDWSFGSAQWLGSWADFWRGFEQARIDWVHAYEHWLDHSWPLGRAEEMHVEGIKHVPHLLDFHDLRRPECAGFWLVMLSCFFYGFMPRKATNETVAQT
jgi:predicted tellurium resistance membrane protein TerC